MRSRRHLLHPRRARLVVWLDADDHGTDTRVTTHVETCHRCATRLDELAVSGGDPDPDGDPGVGSAIADLWEVPAELTGRVQRAIDRRVQAEAELELLLGLVTLGKDTAELLLPSVDEDDGAGAGGREDRS